MNSRTIDFGHPARGDAPKQRVTAEAKARAKATELGKLLWARRRQRGARRKLARRLDLRPSVPTAVAAGLSSLSPTLAMLASLVTFSVLPGPSEAAEPRVAWLGLARGPLSPADGNAVENQLAQALNDVPGVQVVDAGGRPLAQRGLEADAEDVRKLIAKGVDHLLELQYAPADEAIDQAISKFEARLLSSEDYSLLEEALRTRAESYLQQGRKEQARAALMKLAALEPKSPPNEKTHLATFVKLYQDAVSRLGERAMLEVRADGAEILVDGERLGPAPVSAGPLLPGKHYVVARWANGLETKIVQITPGRPASVEVLRKGDFEDARRTLLDTADLKRGQADAKKDALQIIELAEADEVLLASAKKAPEGTVVILARHDRQGRLLTILRALLPPSSLDRARVMSGMISLALVDKRRGELELDAEGKPVSAEGTALLLYGAPSREGSVLVAEGEPTILDADLRPPPVPPEPESDSTWLWVAGGVAIVGAAIVVGVALSSPDPVATDIALRISR